MQTKNLSTLKIHKLSKAQYERELANDSIDENAIYLTPNEEIDLSPYATKEELNTKSDTDHNHDGRYYTETEIDTKINALSTSISEVKEYSDTNLETAKVYADNASSTVQTYADENKVAYGDVIMSTNTFGGKKLYISKIDNGLYCADQRFDVSCKLYDSETNELVKDYNSSKYLLFNGHYDDYDNTSILVNEGQYLVITISNLLWELATYPYGNIYISYYNREVPALEDVSVRVYSEYETTGVGWKNLDVDYFVGSSTSTPVIHKAHNWYYMVSQIEITLKGNSSGSPVHPVEIEMQMDRPDYKLNPFVTKYAEDTLYYNLNAPSFTGRLVGNANTATKATQDASGNVITDTYETKVDADTKLANKADSSHTHDDRYYTETEIDTKVTALEASIDGKADNSHAHAISDVTNLQITIDGIEEDLDKKPGLKVTGTEYMINGETVTAGVGAEVFNIYDGSNRASARYSHAEGYETTALGQSAHAEGSVTKAFGMCSHTEGCRTSTSSDSTVIITSVTNTGYCAHAEGHGTVAFGTCSHAEGNGTIASGQSSHVEGYGNLAINTGAHAEGYGYDSDYTFFSTLLLTGDAKATTYSYTVSDGTAPSSSYAGNTYILYNGASGGYKVSSLDTTNLTITVPYTFSSSAITNKEAYCVQINNSKMHQANLALGKGSHAEGQDTIVLGQGSHVEGYGSSCYSSWAHAEGATTTASGTASHSEGMSTTASGNSAHAEGYSTTASGEHSHAEGQATTASGKVSHAGGINTTAQDYQTVVGRYNRVTTAPTSLTDTTTTAGIFMVGVGTSSSNLLNGFRVNPVGKVYAQQTLTSGTGADYAEYFEWADGNLNEEDRRGHFVTLEGEKIRYATEDDEYILGVVSATPAVIGDAHMEIWHNKFLTDVYGANIEEVVEVKETVDEEGNVIPAHIERNWVLNPDYDPEQEYIPREERASWDAIGVVGKLVVIDDGTCEINGYCRSGPKGIATASAEKTDYRVIARLDDNHIKIFIK